MAELFLPPHYLHCVRVSSLIAAICDFSIGEHAKALQTRSSIARGERLRARAIAILGT